MRSTLYNITIPKLLRIVEMALTGKALVWKKNSIKNGGIKI